MPYPDLPPNPTFWRCPKCGNEQMFRASGSRSISCAECGQSSTQDELLAAHAQAHPEGSPAAR